MHRNHANTKRKLRAATQSFTNTRWFESLEERRLLSAASDITAVTDLTITPDATGTTVTGYTPAQIAKAYGLNSISLTGGVKGNGSGQTIAIVDAYDDPNISKDLATFDSKFSLSAPPSFIKENQSGSTSNLPTSNAGWAGEISLDVEWAHAMAPKANIVLVEANSSSLSDLLTAVNTARNISGVSVVSLSWGANEFYGETNYDSLFTTPTGHTGVTFVASSGDSGSWYGATWPSVSSNVLAVGGTTLTLKDSSGTYGSETGWSNSGGGISYLEPEPGYQSQYGYASGKVAPDVAYDANPNTGFAVYDSIPYQGYSGWEEIGGTSAGAPQWSALVAIADQGRALNHLGTLDGATGTLPDLYSLYGNASSYANGFNDITRGASSWFYSATPGFDAVTGLGTPKGSAVVTALGGGAGGSLVTPTIPTVTTTTTTKHASVHSHHASSALEIVANQPLVTSLSHTEVSVFSNVHVQSSVPVIDSTATAGRLSQNKSGLIGSGDGAGEGGTGMVGNGQQGSTVQLESHVFGVRNIDGHAFSLTHNIMANDSGAVSLHHLLDESEANLPVNADTSTRLITDLNAAHFAAAARTDLLPSGWKEAAALAGAVVLIGAYATQYHRRRIAMMTRGFDAQIDD